MSKRATALKDELVELFAVKLQVEAGFTEPSPLPPGMAQAEPLGCHPTKTDPGLGVAVRVTVDLCPYVPVPLTVPLPVPSLVAVTL